MRKRVADILVETLLSLGVDKNFCVVGGGAMHLNNAFVTHDKIKTVFCHHEQSCAFAAEGYAKLTGKVAIVSVTSGPGAANTINGVYSAWVDSTPMIVIAGHPRYNTTVPACGLNLRCRGVQELDIIPMVAGITKYATMLINPLDVKKVVFDAYNEAMSNRKGPVWISIPLDIQSTIIEEDECTKSNNSVFSPLIKDIDIEEILALVVSAKRPIILTGSALRYSDSMSDFYELTNKLQIPIVGGSLLSDTLPEDYPLFFGLSGNIGPRAGNYIINNSDFILVLGNSLSTRQTGFNVAGFAPNAKIVMVDICEDETKKPGLIIFKSVIADLKAFISALNCKIKKKIVANSNWLNYCKQVYSFFKSFDDVEVNGKQRVPAKYFWKAFREKIPNNAILALGNSNGVIGVYQYGLKHINQRILTNYNAGSMGYDLPEAIGAAVATDAPIICVTGDGSIMMNLQELETIKFNEMPIKVVVFSNKGYGAIRQTCKNFFKGTYTGCDEKSGVGFPDFQKVSNAFGFKYIKCSNCLELSDKIDLFLSQQGNVLLEVDQLLDDPVNPKIMSKLKADGTFETPSFTDLSPFLTEEQQQTIKEFERSLFHV